MSKLTEKVESIKTEISVLETALELRGHLTDSDSITETTQLDEVYRLLALLKAKLAVLIPISKPRQESRRYRQPTTNQLGPAHLMTAREYQHAVYLAKSNKELPVLPDCLMGYGFEDFRPCGVIIREVAALIRYQCQYLIGWSEEQIDQIQKHALKKFIITPTLENFIAATPTATLDPKP